MPPALAGVKAGVIQTLQMGPVSRGSATALSFGASATLINHRDTLNRHGATSNVALKLESLLGGREN
jgi:hypothetical protein